MTSKQKNTWNNPRGLRSMAYIRMYCFELWDWLLHKFRFFVCRIVGFLYWLLHVSCYLLNGFLYSIWMVLFINLLKLVKQKWVLPNGLFWVHDWWIVLFNIDGFIDESVFKIVQFLMDGLF
jgi:hypothetical protein